MKQLTDIFKPIMATYLEVYSKLTQTVIGDTGLLMIPDSLECNQTQLFYIKDTCKHNPGFVLVPLRKNSVKQFSDSSMCLQPIYGFEFNPEAIRMLLYKVHSHPKFKIIIIEQSGIIAGIGRNTINEESTNIMYYNGGKHNFSENMPLYSYYIRTSFQKLNDLDNLTDVAGFLTDSTSDIHSCIVQFFIDHPIGYESKVAMLKQFKEIIFKLNELEFLPMNLIYDEINSLTDTEILQFLHLYLMNVSNSVWEDLENSPLRLCLEIAYPDQSLNTIKESVQVDLEETYLKACIEAPSKELKTQLDRIQAESNNVEKEAKTRLVQADAQVFKAKVDLDTARLNVSEAELVRDDSGTNNKSDKRSQRPKHKNLSSKGLAAAAKIEEEIRILRETEEKKRKEYEQAKALKLKLEKDNLINKNKVAQAKASALELTKATIEAEARKKMNEELEDLKASALSGKGGVTNKRTSTKLLNQIMRLAQKSGLKLEESSRKGSHISIEVKTETTTKSSLPTKSTAATLVEPHHNSRIHTLRNGLSKIIDVIKDLNEFNSEH